MAPNNSCTPVLRPLYSMYISFSTKHWYWPSEDAKRRRATRLMRLLSYLLAFVWTLHFGVVTAYSVQKAGHYPTSSELTSHTHSRNAQRGYLSKRSFRWPMRPSIKNSHPSIQLKSSHPRATRRIRRHP